MKRIFLILAIIIATFTSCQPEVIEPNPTSGNAGSTIELIATHPTGDTTVVYELVINYTTTTGESRNYSTFYDNVNSIIIDSIDWSLPFCASGMGHYGSHNGNIANINYTLYKNDTLINETYNIQNYIWCN